MKISYYELLGMVKEKNIPNEVYVKLQRGLKTVKYVAEYDLIDASLNCFTIFNAEEEDENYHYYLTECFIEMSIFDKCIEIIEEEKEIGKLEIEQDNPSSNYYIRNEYGTKCALTKHSKMIAEKVNELIDEINKLKENK